MTERLAIPIHSVGLSWKRHLTTAPLLPMGLPAPCMAVALHPLMCKSKWVYERPLCAGRRAGTCDSFGTATNNSIVMISSRTSRSCSL